MGIKTYITIGYFVFCSVFPGVHRMSRDLPERKRQHPNREQLMLEVEAEFPKIIGLIGQY
jgi:hypothetical protein